MTVTEQAAVDRPVSPWLRDGGPGARIMRGIVRSDDDARAIEQIQPDRLLAGGTLLECIKAAAEIEPGKSAIIQLLSSDPDAEPLRLSYAEVVSRITRAANLFKALAGARTPSIAIMAPFLPEALIATWGGATAGVATPLNPALDVRQIASIMIAAKTNILVTATSAYGPGAWQRVDEIRALVPNLRSVLVIDSPGDDNFQRRMDAHSGETLAFAPNDEPDAVVAHIPTGGTTGAPKLVRLTNRGQLLNAWLFGAMFGSARDEVLGHAMPNFHVGGLVALALRAMIFGQTLLTLTPAGFRDPGLLRNFWDIARRHRMTGVIMAPATVAALLNQRDSTSEGHCIRNFICGGSTIPVELMHDFFARTGIYLKETWGMTEFQGPCSGHLANDAMPVIGSVGKPYPFHKVRVVHLDKGAFVADAAPGERGILVVAGPTLSPGYVDERLSEELFVTNMPDALVWASTGDLGTVDSDGYVWVYGREKDLIIRAGGNIDPKLIEEALAHHPAVLLSAAVGRPDPVKGELPMVYVELKAGALATPEEILDFCARHVPERAAVPVEAVILPAMPMTAVAKIAKPALRLDAMRRVVAKVARSVLGDSGRAEVDIDESGKRPAAIIRVDIAAGEKEAVGKRLRDAFAGYAFRTEILFA